MKRDSHVPGQGNTGRHIPSLGSMNKTGKIPQIRDKNFSDERTPIIQLKQSKDDAAPLNHRNN